MDYYDSSSHHHHSSFHHDYSSSHHHHSSSQHHHSSSHHHHSSSHHHHPSSHHHHPPVKPLPREMDAPATVSGDAYGLYHESIKLFQAGSDSAKTRGLNPPSPRVGRLPRRPGRQQTVANRSPNKGRAEDREGGTPRFPLTVAHRTRPGPVTNLPLARRATDESCTSTSTASSGANASSAAAAPDELQSRPTKAVAKYELTMQDRKTKKGKWNE